MLEQANVQGDGSSFLPTDSLYNCPPTVQSSSGDSSWTWLQIPGFTYEVSDDGQSIIGSDGDATWSFHAVRE